MRTKGELLGYEEVRWLRVKLALFQIFISGVWWLNKKKLINLTPVRKKIQLFQILILDNPFKPGRETTRCEGTGGGPVGGSQERPGANHGSVAAELEQHIPHSGRVFYWSPFSLGWVLRTKEQKTKQNKNK